MGNSLAVELPALDRAALVRIQISQPLCRRLPGFLMVVAPFAKNAAVFGGISDRLQFAVVQRDGDVARILKFRPGVSNEAFECTRAKVC
jgi:hypothetical protein